MRRAGETRPVWLYIRSHYGADGGPEPTVSICSGLGHIGVPYTIHSPAHHRALGVFLVKIHTGPPAPPEGLSGAVIKLNDPEARTATGYGRCAWWTSDLCCLSPRGLGALVVTQAARDNPAVLALRVPHIVQSLIWGALVTYLSPGHVKYLGGHVLCPGLIRVIQALGVVGRAVGPDLSLSHTRDLKATLLLCRHLRHA